MPNTSGRKLLGIAALAALATLVGTAASPAREAPAPRACFAMVHAGAHGVVLFGGSRSCGLAPLDDRRIWGFDGSAWRVLTTAPEAVGAREDALLAHDAKRGVLVLHGGRRGETVFDDTWEWDGEAWHERRAETRPSPLEHAAIAFDPSRGRAVVFGGAHRSRGAPFDATWEWDGATWRAAEPAGPRPAARLGHAMAWSPAHGAVLLYGGFGPEGSFRDLWAYDGERWRELDAKGPGDSEGGALAATSDRVLLLTAHGEDAQRSALWSFADGAWSLVTDGGPAVLVGQALAHDAAREKLVLFGGHVPDRPAERADVWELDGTRWSKASAPR